uniref:Uncharacterized protein n=1 Tax=Rhizophora mucronata TaxID=61149 RepID=A0A2P2KLL7_RHIMU
MSIFSLNYSRKNAVYHSHYITRNDAIQKSLSPIFSNVKMQDPVSVHQVVNTHSEDTLRVIYQNLS